MFFCCSDIGPVQPCGWELLHQWINWRKDSNLVYFWRPCCWLDGCTGDSHCCLLQSRWAGLLRCLFLICSYGFLMDYKFFSVTLEKLLNVHACTVLVCSPQWLVRWQEIVDFMMHQVLLGSILISSSWIFTLLCSIILGNFLFLWTRNCQ